IDETILAKARGRFARDRVYRNESRTGREDNSRRRPFAAGPICDPARGGVARGSLYVQTSFPVSASSARTRLPPGKYITLLTTIGVASGLAVGAAGAPPRPRAPRAPASASGASPLGASPRRPPAGPGAPSLKVHARVRF